MANNKFKITRQLGAVGKLFSIIPDTTAIINKAMDNGRPIIEKHMEQRQEKKKSLVKIDNVIDLPIDEARTFLESKGFIVSTILAKPNKKLSQSRPNEVVKMFPKPGKQSKGSLVKLFYVNDDIIETSRELIREETRRKEEINHSINESIKNIKNIIPFEKLKK